ncbi:MAG: hypothetical protein IJY36_05565 [Coprobacter sp.]|nr:hypothetical protein [Coprobacter sp.]
MGNEIPSYYVIEYPDWVNVIAITRDGKFVFERKYRHAMGLIHISFSVENKEQVDAMARRLTADGYSLLMAPYYGRRLLRVYYLRTRRSVYRDCRVNVNIFLELPAQS